MNKEGLKHIGIEAGKSALYVAGMLGLGIAPYSYIEMSSSINEIHKDLWEIKSEEQAPSGPQKPITLKEKEELLLAARKVYSLDSSITDGMITEHQSQLIKNAYDNYNSGKLYENLAYFFGAAAVGSLILAFTDSVSEFNENYYNHLYTPLKFPPNIKNKS